MRPGSAVALLALLAGCSSPQPDPLPPGNPPAYEAAHAIAELPPRPAELSVDGVDPCTLFTHGSLNRLGITQRPQQIGTEDGATCVLSQQQLEPMYDLQVTAVADAGIATWITGNRARPATMAAEPAAVAGFPALTVFPESQPTDHCDVVVGIGQSQSLLVRFGTAYTGEFPHQHACSLTKRAATAAVDALRQQG